MFPSDDATQGALRRLYVRLSAMFAPLTHTHSAADVVSGTLGTARLGSGTANSTTYLRGDSTWAAVAGGVTSVNSQTGAVSLTQDNVPDGTTAKQYTATEKTKLAGVAASATANDTDANLKNRANHTGTQLASTVSNFDAQVTTVAGALDALLPHLFVPKWQSGLWYESIYQGFNPANVAMVAGTVYYVPITIPSTGQIAEVGMSCATGAASSALHFGIYADSNGVPGALIRNFGNTSSVASGLKSLTALAQAITPGLYWLAVAAIGGAPTTVFHSAPTSSLPIIGLATLSGAQVFGYNQTGVSALPATATPVTTTATGRPRICLKWS